MRVPPDPGGRWKRALGCVMVVNSRDFPHLKSRHIAPRQRSQSAISGNSLSGTNGRFEPLEHPKVTLETRPNIGQICTKAVAGHAILEDVMSFSAEELIARNRDLLAQADAQRRRFQRLQTRLGDRKEALDRLSWRNYIAWKQRHPNDASAWLHKVQDEQRDIKRTIQGSLGLVADARA